MERLEVPGVVYHNAHVPSGVRNSAELLPADRGAARLFGRQNQSLDGRSKLGRRSSLALRGYILGSFLRKDVSHRLLPDIVADRDVNSRSLERNAITYHNLVIYSFHVFFTMNALSISL